MPIKVEEQWAPELAGLSLRNVEFQVENPKEEERDSLAN